MLISSTARQRCWQALTGHEDLSRVTYLEARVDGEDPATRGLGARLPALLELRLSGSRVSSVPPPLP